MVDDDGSGKTGTIINNAWKTQLYDQIDANPAWIAVPFNAANFVTDGAATWTVTAGNVTTLSYAIVGKVLIIQIAIGPTVLSGPANECRVKIPGLVTPINSQGIGRINPVGSTFVPALMYTLPGNNYVGFLNLAGTALQASANLFTQGTIITAI
jgi:hypothetical protein